MLINACSQRVLVKPKNLQKAVIFSCIDSFCKKKKNIPKIQMNIITCFLRDLSAKLAFMLASWGLGFLYEKNSSAMS